MADPFFFPIPPASGCAEPLSVARRLPYLDLAHPMVERICCRPTLPLRVHVHSYRAQTTDPCDLRDNQVLFSQ